MKNKTKKNIGIGILIVFLIGLLIYFSGIFSLTFTTNECAYVDPSDPYDNLDDIYCYKNIIYDDGRELYTRITLNQDLVDQIKNGEKRVVSATINDDFVVTTYKDAKTIVDVYATSNEWDAKYGENPITWNNKPDKQQKIGEAYTPASISSDIPTELSSNFNDNLLDYVKENINNGENELSFVLVHGGNHMHNFEIKNLQIILETEESQTFYRLQDNSCSKVQLFQEEIGMNDYETLEQCEANIDEGSVDDGTKDNETDEGTVDDGTDTGQEEIESTIYLVIIAGILISIALGLSSYYIYRRFK